MTPWQMGSGALLKSKKTTSALSLFTELAFSSWFTKRLFALGKFLVAVPDHCLVIHEFGNCFHWICSITSSRTKVRLTSLRFPGSSVLLFVKMTVMFVFFQLPAHSLIGMTYGKGLAVTLVSSLSTPGYIPSQPIEFRMSRWLRCSRTVSFSAVVTLSLPKTLLAVSRNWVM